MQNEVGYLHNVHNVIWHLSHGIHEGGAGAHILLNRQFDCVTE